MPLEVDQQQRDRCGGDAADALRLFDEMGVEVPYPQRVVRHVMGDGSAAPGSYGDVAAPAPVTEPPPPA